MLYSDKFQTNNLSFWVKIQIKNAAKIVKINEIRKYFCTFLLFTVNPICQRSIFTIWS